LAFALVGLDLGLAAGFGEAFATTVFLDVGFAIGFGVVFARGAGVALGFGCGVAVAVGFGVADGNSISLFAVVTTGFSSATSSRSDPLDSVSVGGCFDDGDSWFSDSPAARSPAPPNHTMLSGFDEGLAATLQRMSPAISATCASAIRTTFRQKRPLGAPYLCEAGPFAIYFDSAFVAMPTFVIPARCNAFITPINFCTGKSRSGRITMAISGFVCFSCTNCVVRVSRSIT
jgi:hypothetical protein